MPDDGSFDISTLGSIAAVAVVLVLAFVFVLVVFSYGKLWLQAFVSNARVSMFSLIGMSLRQVHARTIVDAAETGIGPDQIGDAVRQAVDRGLTTPDRLRRAATGRGHRVERLINAAVATVTT